MNLEIKVIAAAWRESPQPKAPLHEQTMCEERVIHHRGFTSEVNFHRDGDVHDGHENTFSEMGEHG